MKIPGELGPVEPRQRLKTPVAARNEGGQKVERKHIGIMHTQKRIAGVEEHQGDHEGGAGEKTAADKRSEGADGFLSQQKKSISLLDGKPDKNQATRKDAEEKIVVVAEENGRERGGGGQTFEDGGTS